MDNANKIATIEAEVQKETALFLQADVLEKIRKKTYDVYDIETEYAKTTKNRSWFVILLMGGTLLITGMVLWIASRIIENQIREISVNIESFEDINLKNILDLANRVETSYQSTVNERATLEGHWVVEISDLETAAEGERYKIRALSLSYQETAKKIAAIDRKLESNIREVNRHYTEQIQELDAKIAEYAKQIASFDRDRIEQAQEMQKIADAAFLRFQYEKEELITRYENQLAVYRAMVAETQQERLKTQTGSLDEVVDRYTAEIAALDPVLRNEAAEQIMSQTGIPDAPLPLTRGTPEIFAPADGHSPLFAKMNEDYAQMDSLTQELLVIPWKNNTPGYIRSMNGLFFTSLREIGDEINRFAGSIGEQKIAFETQIEEQRVAFEAQIEEQRAVLEAQIAELSGRVDTLIAENQTLMDDLQFSNKLLTRNRTYFDALSKKNGVAGYIIDPQNERDLLVYIDPLYGLSFKDWPAFVFRTGNEYIGTIQVSGDNKVFTASVVELSPGRRIEAGDRILLSVRKF
jgi:hypothetical protein